MFTSFIFTSNNIYYIRSIRNRDLGRTKKKKERCYGYVGKAKDFNLWKILLYSIRHNKSYNQEELLPDSELLKTLQETFIVGD